jgi:hypothetical protein
MKRTFILAALLLPGFSLNAQELPPDLPGMSPGAPAAEDAAIQRPDADRILSDLGPELRLSSRQEERLTGAVNKKAKEFDALFNEYEKASAEEKKWRYKVNELKYKMSSVNRSIPDAVRELLDDEQRQNFDALLEAKRNPKPALPPEIDSAEKTEPAALGAEEPKPMKKKRLVKRKKLPRAGASAPAQPAAAAAPENEEGMTMVDKDSSSDQNPAPRKKRVLRKKTAPPAPDGAEAPAAEGDAGSYP